MKDQLSEDQKNIKRLEKQVEDAKKSERDWFAQRMALWEACRNIKGVLEKLIEQEQSVMLKMAFRGIALYILKAEEKIDEIQGEDE